ncbi:permease [uncultured Ruminococcus sp.]|uniref:aspartate-alanine antiporter-like transporter n=1 Tax=uncultured Ruminococcus sp. TaxID=165186 RepID=UPI00260B4205|nr:permease [uncultured Ruminococcus sp.]
MSFHFLEVLGVNLFNMKTMALVIFMIFGIIAIGYLIGKISIKGVTLGSAAIFIVALVAGHFLQLGLDNITEWSEAGGWTSIKPYFSMTQNLGLILFVTSVGLIAGPTFFKNLVKNFKSYVLLGLIIILSGAGTCALVTILVPDMNSAMSVGLLSGSLTSTPAFAAAQEALQGTEFYDQIAVGHGVAYPFGVIGVVLFVQIMPRLLHADMDKERAMLMSGDQDSKKEVKGKLFEMDKFGLGAFALTVVTGLILGCINIPLGNNQSFNLGTTGGPLIMGLIFGHFGRIGKLSLKVNEHVVSIFQELGLILFLVGAGVDGGREFVSTLSEFGPMLFVYGALMTLVPLILGFIIAKFVLKMSLFNNLGSLCGGMTSTPALGALINVTGTSNVASAYAATYPIALIAVVLASQFLTYL